MTKKELIDRTLRFEKGIDIPFAVLNGHGWICKKHGLSTEDLLAMSDYGAKLLVDEYKTIGSDILYAGGCDAPFVFLSVMGGKVDNSIVGGAPEITLRPLEDIEDIDDYDVNEVIAMMRKDPIYRASIAQTVEMRKLVGDEYHISVGSFGPFTNASQLLGVDNFMAALLMDEDGYVDKLVQFATEITVAQHEDYIAAGGSMVCVPEPVATGDLISPGSFDEFVAPYLKQVRERTDASCPMMVHICSETSKRVAPVAETGCSIFSVDSIDMVKAQEDSAGRMALFGNLSPAGIILEKSVDEVYKASIELCRSMKSWGGFILAPGCDVPPDATTESLIAMRRAADNVSAEA